MLYKLKLDVVINLSSLYYSNY